ncbi:MAG: hypothetical protein ACO1OQ_14405 [Rufibacter sp.]
MKQEVKAFITGAMLAVLLIAASPAAAQVEYLSPAQQKKEVRRALKEAKKIKSDYSESHLNVQAYNFKKGESGRKQVNPQEHDEMIMNEDGTPVTKPKAKAKKKSKAKKKR